MNMTDFLDWARNAQQNNLETRDQMKAMERQQQRPLKPMEVTPSIEDAIRARIVFPLPIGKLNGSMNVGHRQLRPLPFVAKRHPLRVRSKSLGGWFG